MEDAEALVMVAMNPLQKLIVEFDGHWEGFFIGVAIFLIVMWLMRGDDE